MNNQVMIKKDDFDFIIKKSDVWLVYTKNNSRPWICCLGGVTVDANFYYLDLAKK